MLRPDGGVAVRQVGVRRNESTVNVTPPRRPRTTVTHNLVEVSTLVSIPSVLAQSAAVSAVQENKIPMNALESNEEKTPEKVSKGDKGSPSNKHRNAVTSASARGDDETVRGPMKYPAEAFPCKAAGAQQATAASREAEAARRGSWAEEVDAALPVCGNLEHFGSLSSDYVDKVVEEDFNGSDESLAPVPVPSKARNSPGKIVPGSTQSKISKSPAKAVLVLRRPQVTVMSFMREVLECLPRDGVYRRPAATLQDQESRHHEQHLTHFQGDRPWMKSLWIRSRRQVRYRGRRSMEKKRRCAEQKSERQHHQYHD